MPSWARKLRNSNSTAKAGKKEVRKEERTAKAPKANATAKAPYKAGLATYTIVPTENVPI